MDQDKEGEKVERNLVQDCLSGETNDEKSQRVQDQHPGQESLSGESDVDEKVPDESFEWPGIKKGMREVGNSMSVMPTGQGSKEIAISLAIDRVV